MPTRTTAQKVRRKNFLLAVELEERANHVGKRLKKDFSQLTREALEEYVGRLEREILEQELAAGYTANAKLIEEMNREWEAADAD